MTATRATPYVASLLSFNHWLFANDRPSIVARLDIKSLSDGRDIHEFGASNKKRPIKELEDALL